MVSYKAVYNRKNRLDADGKALVQIESYQAGKRRYFSTEVRIAPASWNVKNREVKNDAIANQRIREKLHQLQQFEITFHAIHQRSLTLADFDLLMVKGEEVQPLQTFSAFMKEQLEADKPGVSQVTYQRRIRVLNRLNKHQNGEVVFSQLTFAYINGFDQAKRGRFNLDDNTIETEHKILKRYVDRAVKSGFLERNRLPLACLQAVKWRQCPRC